MVRGALFARVSQGRCEGTGVKNPWFRLYHRIIDDEKIRLLAFEDRWHFVAVCCLKADGLIDEPDSDLKWRKVAVKLGVQVRELGEIARRLSEVGLTDEHMNPMAWNELQYKNDSSAERVRKFREKTKASNVKRPVTVTVTAQETDTDTDTDVISNEITKRETRKKDDPMTELEAVLSRDVALGVMKHRDKIKKPLTALGAKKMASEFAKCADPDDAAATMVARGWQGFDADWMTERIPKQAQFQRKENTVDVAKRLGWFDAEQNEDDAYRNVEFLPANNG